VRRGGGRGGGGGGRTLPENRFRPRPRRENPCATLSCVRPCRRRRRPNRTDQWQRGVPSKSLSEPSVVKLATEQQAARRVL